MRSVLGIDAAWTAGEPSGVALVIEEAGRWHCAGLAPSYAQFLALAEGKPVNWQAKPAGDLPDPARLLDAARALAGAAPDIIAVDMPLATTPIVARRPADNVVSSIFGAARAGVHSPSAIRPGPIADNLRAGLAAHGYPLLVAPGGTRGLVETYPHPIIMQLCRSRHRVTYKAGKVGKFWKDAEPTERRSRLLTVWSRIAAALEAEVDGMVLPDFGALHGAPSSHLKRVEDCLDALVCCVGGMRLLQGRAVPHGDREAAIWLPAGCDDFRLNADFAPWMAPAAAMAAMKVTA